MLWRNEEFVSFIIKQIQPIFSAWNNLSEAEIAAITVGALMALLFIIAITVLIIYCIRKRKSHDLPYTQRYGSRPPTQSERTTF